jgi:hypothetical protein
MAIFYATPVLREVLTNSIKIERSFLNSFQLAKTSQASEILIHINKPGATKPAISHRGIFNPPYSIQSFPRGWLTNCRLRQEARDISDSSEHKFAMDPMNESAKRFG